MGNKTAYEGKLYVRTELYPNSSKFENLNMVNAAAERGSNELSKSLLYKR